MYYVGCERFRDHLCNYLSYKHIAHPMRGSKNGVDFTTKHLQNGNKKYN